MYNINPEIKLKAIKEYFENGKSLREIASMFNVNYKSVYKWTKLYKEKGEDFFLLNNKIAWNRTKEDIEKKIVLLKERKPSISIRKAKEILENEGIKISVKCIWNIWKRYGFVNIRKINITNDFTECYEWTKEIKAKYEIAKNYFEKGDFIKCAEILNELPYLPKNELILKIPDKYLNVYRKIEKAVYLFGKEKLNDYIKRIKKILKILRKNKLYYSLLRISNFYLIALEWKGDFKEIIKEAKKLKKLIGSSECLLIFKWTTLVSEAIAHIHLLNIKEAKEIAKICEQILKRKKYSSPYFEFDLGILWFALENYKKAEEYYLNSLERVEENFKKKIKGEIFRIYLIKGDLRSIKKFQKGIEIGEWGENAFYLSFLALLNLLRGKVEKSMEFAKNALDILEKEGLKSHIFQLYLTMASIYSAIGEKNKGISLLKSIINFLEKNGLKKQALILKILTSKKSIKVKKLSLLPTIKLLFLIKNKKIKEAFFYAKRNYILSYFYIYTFLLKENFSDIHLKKLNFPKRFLKLPIFSKETLLYKIKFLGDLRVYKFKEDKKKYLKINLTPKEKALLIHFALRAGEPDKKVDVKELIDNFWERCKNPLKNLAKACFNIRKNLGIPPNFLEISKKREEKFLKNNGVYFITDYSDFENNMAQANAFLNSGEWELAKNYFLKGVKIVKKEPFEKIYDTWSEDLRSIILNKYERELIKFVNECKKRGETKIATNTLKRAEKILNKIIF
ncbi:MAG: helix-turn-helix domain-containing protein [Nitrososphaerota archaeon]